MRCSSADGAASGTTCCAVAISSPALLHQSRRTPTKNCARASAPAALPQHPAGDVDSAFALFLALFLKLTLTLTLKLTLKLTLALALALALALTLTLTLTLAIALSTFCPLGLSNSVLTFLHLCLLLSERLQNERLQNKSLQIP